MKHSISGPTVPRQWSGPISQEFFFAADDLSPEASLHGLVSLFFASYSAGTPAFDDFARQTSRDQQRIAEQAFLARLPVEMLGHSAGGALAVIGLVGRAWGSSSTLAGRQGNEQQTAVYGAMIRRLLEGHRVGFAMEYFNERYAELSTVLSDELEEIEFGKQTDYLDLTRMWIANNDARNFIIIGDPAVRLTKAIS